LNQNCLFSDIKYRQIIAKEFLKPSQIRVMVWLYSISLNKQFWFNPFRYVKWIRWGSLYLSATLSTGELSVWNSEKAWFILPHRAPIQQLRN
jgi:hypothetical protein